MIRKLEAGSRWVRVMPDHQVQVHSIFDGEDGVQLIMLVGSTKESIFTMSLADFQKSFVPLCCLEGEGEGEDDTGSGAEEVD